jgi:hypothetical protein
MIDPLALLPRTLEACRPAAERAEERVAEAAVECPATPEIAGCTRCHSARVCGARTAESAHDTKRSNPHESPVVRAAQRPKGQGACVASYRVAQGWR